MTLLDLVNESAEKIDNGLELIRSVNVNEVILSVQFSLSIILYFVFVVFSVITCGFLEAPDNGKVSCTSSESLDDGYGLSRLDGFGTTCVFDCDVREI